jgi:(E)-4-hydroxy-3-methyl-but-2-enyl pyrophosphate reductase
LRVKTAGQLGYCSGVSEAIRKAIEYGDEHGRVYSLGTVAHNDDVVALLKSHGVHPITRPSWWLSIEKTNGDSYVVITAHGATPETYNKIAEMECKVLDCTCPIVGKAQAVARTLAADGFDVVIFGDPQHQEVKGLVGWSMGACKFVGNWNQLFTPEQQHQSLGLADRVGVLSQTTKPPSDYSDFFTTLGTHHLDRFRELKVFNTICPIVAQRIEDTRKLATEVDMMFVVGSAESANTQNLVRVAKSAMGPLKHVFLVLRDGDIAAALTGSFYDVRDDATAGVTAGTSTPIEVVQKVVERLEKY